MPESVRYFWTGVVIGLFFGVYIAYHPVQTIQDIGRLRDMVVRKIHKLPSCDENFFNCTPKDIP